MRERERNLSVRLDDAELAKLHHLARVDDLSVGQMLRRWLSERYAARFGNAEPPETRTKFGDVVKPSAKSGGSQ